VPLGLRILEKEESYAVPTTAPDDLRVLVEKLPERLQGELRAIPHEDLIEIVMDLGRVPQARFPGRVANLGTEVVSQDDIDDVVGKLGSFTGDNRAGIERTLHRISAIRNRQGRIIGLTLRVGRAIFGTIEPIRDLVESGRNILLLGPPGVGKTTKLREVARVLADDAGKRVMVVDTSNEIGGDGDIPHPGIGSARRMQVPNPERQHAVMIEAVENHMPEVIIVDEIGTEAEAAAARTIAERGVQLVATAHGNSLENLVMNPVLSDLVGGVHTVTLGDEEARRRGTPKTINERRAPPTFDIVVELLGRDELLVHPDTAEAVDRLLANKPVGGERRTIGPDGELQREPLEEPDLPEREETFRPRLGPTRVCPYAVSPVLLERVIRELRLDAVMVERLEQADVVIALRSRADDPRLRRAADRRNLRVFTVKRNGSSPIRRALQDAFYVAEGLDEEELREAVRETEFAIQRVLTEGIPVALSPQRPAVRRIQHRMVARHHLSAESVGKEPQRHLVIHP